MSSRASKDAVNRPPQGDQLAHAPNSAFMDACQLIRKMTKIEVVPLNQESLAARWSISEATPERWRSVGIGLSFLKLCGRGLPPRRYRGLRGVVRADIEQPFGRCSCAVQLNSSANGATHSWRGPRRSRTSPTTACRDLFSKPYESCRGFSPCGCASKKRSISRAASGPLGSV